MSHTKISLIMIVFNQTGKGTYWRAYHFARVLAGRGYAVTLISTSKDARRNFSVKEVDGIELIETPDALSGSLRSGYDPWNVIKRISWLGDRKFDIVHAFESRPVVIYPALKASKNGAILILDWADWFGRGGSIEERNNPIIRSILGFLETYYENHFRKHPSGTTVINTFLKERATQFGVQPEKILLLRNGSDTRAEIIDRYEARDLSGLPEDGPLIGFVGGTYTSDAQMMAQAFNQVLLEYPAAKLLLVGYFNRDIESLIKKPGSIIRTGPLDSEQVHIYLSASDICWLPLGDTGANIGRWPYKLNDYMTAGRATISTDIGDLGNVIPAYQLGIITKPDPASFASGTVELLDSPERACFLGTKAREAAEQNFEWQIITNDLENFYLRLLSDHLT